MANRRAQPIGNKLYKVQVRDENAERVLFETGPYTNIGHARSSAAYYKGNGHYRKGAPIRFKTSILVLEGEWTEA